MKALSCVGDRNYVETGWMFYCDFLYRPVTLYSRSGNGVVILGQ